VNDVQDPLARLLKQAWPPLDPPGTRRDLWPELRRRLGERHVKVSGWDLLLVAALVTLLLAFPQVLPGLLYHL
jgi:hypothetical protein